MGDIGISEVGSFLVSGTVFTEIKSVSSMYLVSWLVGYLVN